VTHVRGHEVVPESVLRKRKTLAEIKEKREETLAAQRVKRSNKPAAGALFKKAAAFVKDYRQKYASGTRLARESKKLRGLSDSDVEAKLVSVHVCMACVRLCVLPAHCLNIRIHTRLHVLCVCVYVCGVYALPHLFYFCDLLFDWQTR